MWFITVLAVVISVVDAARVCQTPSGGVNLWYYDNESDGPYSCTYDHDKNETTPWGMLNAYRSGGEEWQHWRYVKDNDTSGCLKNWHYYSKDGATLLEVVDGYTTARGSKYGDKWCAKRVYRPKGLRTFQWDYCNCFDSSVISA